MRFDKQIRERIRLQHKSDSTADAYVHWFNRYLSFCQANELTETKRICIIPSRLTGLASFFSQDDLPHSKWGERRGQLRLRPVLDPVRQPTRVPPSELAFRI